MFQLQKCIFFRFDENQYFRHLRATQEAVDLLENLSPILIYKTERQAHCEQHLHLFPSSQWVPSSHREPSDAASERVVLLL